MHFVVWLSVKFIFFWYLFHWKLRSDLRKARLVKSRSNLDPIFTFNPFGVALLRPGLRIFQWNRCQKNMNLKCIGSWKLRSVLLIKWHLAIMEESYCAWWLTIQSTFWSEIEERGLLIILIHFSSLFAVINAFWLNFLLNNIEKVVKTWLLYSTKQWTLSF